MKYQRILIFIFSIMFFSCNDNGNSKSDNKSKNTNPIDKEPIKSEEVNYPKNIKNCNQSFEDFFEQFAKDSLFQKSRVKYPLKESYYEDLESSEITIDMVSASEYHYLDFKEDENALNKELDKYRVIIEKIDDENVYYNNVGIDNGINITFKFKLIEGCWYMVEIEDKST